MTKTINCNNCETSTAITVVGASDLDDADQMEPEFCPFCGEHVFMELDFEQSPIIEHQEEFFEE